MDTMVTLKRGSQRVDIEPDSVNTAILRRSFKVSRCAIGLLRTTKLALSVQCVP